MESALRVFMVVAMIVVGLYLLTGCSQYQADAGTPSVYTTPANAQECPSGGTIVVVNGYPYTICNGLAGASGSPGSVGPAGPVGEPGLPGLNATPVTTVRFCPSNTAVYPTTFPEYGICLGGQLYGVYSANGGFLALLPPGAYSSDGINDSCTFTIKANCVVSQ
jgi:hypothetical protein